MSGPSISAPPFSYVHTERVAWRRVALTRVNAPENQANLISTLRDATPHDAFGVNAHYRTTAAVANLIVSEKSVSETNQTFVELGL